MDYGDNPLAGRTFSIGSHVVQLRVTDNQGLQATDNVIINVLLVQT